MRRMTLAAVLVLVLGTLAGSGVAAAKTGGGGHGKGDGKGQDHGKGHGHGKKHKGKKHRGKGNGTPTVKILASGFNNPRGLTFGPGGLYVAEGGLGGTHSSADDNCPQAHGDAAPYFGSTNDPTLGGRISRIDRKGNVSMVVDALPSSQTSPALGSLVSGVSSVQFIGHKLYGLLAGAGCSHGVPTVPNGVFKVDKNGGWNIIADLSAFQAANPVAQPDDEDFEPDGTWYSMAAAGGALYPMDSNHGELDKVTRSGKISRVVDISAQLGHVVPTAITLGPGKHKARGWKHHHRTPNFYIANLGVFGPEDGTVPNESVWKLGNDLKLKQRGVGLEQVLGLVFRGGKLYALEMSNTPGGPMPGTGAIVQVGPKGPKKTIVSGLVFPTGMTVGRDGAFYVSEQGFGFGAGDGRVLRITIH
jgi:hypothetical protein